MQSNGSCRLSLTASNTVSLVFAQMERNDIRVNIQEECLDREGIYSMRFCEHLQNVFLRTKRHNGSLFYATKNSCSVPLVWLPTPCLNDLNSSFLCPNPKFQLFHHLRAKSLSNGETLVGGERSAMLTHFFSHGQSLWLQCQLDFLSLSPLQSLRNRHSENVAVGVILSSIYGSAYSIIRHYLKGIKLFLF